MKRKIIDFAKKYHFVMMLIRKLKFIKGRINYLFYYTSGKVDDKLIIFEAFNGRKYNDSPKAVYLELLNNKDFKDYTFVWGFINPSEFKDLEKNKNTKLVKVGSKEYKRIYSKAKYWFTTSSLPNYIVPKKNQVYCQFWHGTPLKRLGFDIKTEGTNAMRSVKDWQKIYESDAKRYTYMVSPSKFCSEKFISAFNLKHIKKDTAVIETGYPRNDALFKYTDKEILKIKKELNVPKDKTVILYAPTWRDDQHDSALGYTYKTEVDFDYLKKELSDNYVILFRAHYLIANSFNFDKYKGFLYDVSSYNDINDLYIVSDILITDYSSVFFDYANLKRPMIFYMYDFNNYKEKSRDFYINLDELPGPIIKDVDEKLLVKEIKGINKSFTKYKDDYKKFNGKYNYLDDKNSSKRVIDIVFKEK